ncbi:MAG TPA: hypothetical protein ENK28_01345 [Aliiroseovarius sp.]|nr:hypothetical protein [Aliiroseovarius sp.]
MTRIIVHAGFHKTGTSSLQQYLRRTRRDLAQYGAIYLKEDFLDAGNAGRIYGLKPFPWRLRRFRRHLRGFLESIPDDKVIFLSWEGFCGVMPGHRRIGGRSVRDMATSGIPLARAIVKELRRRFGPDADITFLYTLRDREPWINSVYGHIVRSIRLTMDFDSFRASLPNLPTLQEEATRIARAIAPVPVETARLEALKSKAQGPAYAALTLIGVPEDVIATLPPARKVNAGNTADIRRECLRLNRTIKDDLELKRLKDKLTGHERTGKARNDR